jgi:hypothetical protein
MLTVYVLATQCEHKMYINFEHKTLQIFLNGNERVTESQHNQLNPHFLTLLTAHMQQVPQILSFGKRK